VSARRDGSDKQMFPDRPAGKPVRNSGGASCPACTLQEAITRSLNTTFYGLTYEVGPMNVRDVMLRATGLPETWAGGNLKGRTTLADPQSGGTDSGLGIGQYEMRPIDQAVGFATFAAGGVHRNPYFVAKVTDNAGNQLLGQPADSGEQVIPNDVANDVTFAIEGVAQYSKRALDEGRVVGSKTGTVGSTDQDNSDAWMVGYTPSISAAVWMGTDGNQPIVNAQGKIIFGSGLPGAIWQKFMNAVLDGTPKEGMATKALIHGDTGEGVAEPTTARRAPRADTQRVALDLARHREGHRGHLVDELVREHARAVDRAAVQHELEETREVAHAGVHRARGHHAAEPVEPAVDVPDCARRIAADDVAVEGRVVHAERREHA